MKSIDLRSNYERVYNQGAAGSCGPHAIAACLDVMYERATGKAHRFDKQSIYENCHAFMGVYGDQYGVSWPAVRHVAQAHGFKLHDATDYIKGFEVRRVQMLDGWNTYKHLLQMGIPVMLSIRAGSAFNTSGANKGLPWQKHRWGQSFQTILDYQYTHAVALVGYDDDAQCWLLENSWGAEWGDGGFFGIPYDQMEVFREDAHYFSELPVKTVPVEGADMTVGGLYVMEAADFVERSKGALKSALMEATQKDGAQGAVNYCKHMGLSDKHVEFVMGWQRGSVKQFKTENPALNWDGFVWDQA